MRENHNLLVDGEQCVHGNTIFVIGAKQSKKNR